MIYFFSDYQREDEEMKGSGLGLTLVKEITEGYGGNVELLPESEFRSGASFLVTLKKEEISLKHEENRSNQASLLRISHFCNPFSRNF